MTQCIQAGARVKITQSKLFPTAVGQRGTVLNYPYAGRRRVLVRIDPDPGTHYPDWQLVFSADELEEIRL